MYDAAINCYKNFIAVHSYALFDRKIRVRIPRSLIERIKWDR